MPGTRDAKKKKIKIRGKEIKLEDKIECRTYTFIFIAKVIIMVSRFLGNKILVFSSLINNDFLNRYVLIPASQKASVNFMVTSSSEQIIYKDGDFHFKRFFFLNYLSVLIKIFNFLYF